MSKTQGAANVDRFAAAHAALRADPSVQFAMTPAPLPPKPPEWLVALGHWLARLFRPLGRFVRWLFGWLPDLPYARILLWSVLAVAAIALAFMAYERIRHGEWRLPRLRRRRAARVEVEGEPDWMPDAAPVHAWLSEADALAARGRYGEAIHHLLLRSVDDIRRRRPAIVRPAATSRELADAHALPVAARASFAGIARLVEASLFGGRAVDRDDWASARTAYADFALPVSWRG